MDFTKRELIKTINVNEANFEHISKTKAINGSLLIDIERIMQVYADQEAKAYAHWLSNQVIAGRTSAKLWNDYKSQIVESKEQICHKDNQPCEHACSSLCHYLKIDVSL